MQREKEITIFFLKLQYCILFSQLFYCLVTHLPYGTSVSNRLNKKINALLNKALK